MSTKHFNITVSGKVQGVFYRQSTMEKARELELKGFVRNEANGDVYLEAEGSDEKLEELVKWCRQGPSRARVERVNVSEGELKNFTDFIIKR
jgi:acylphosphatase